MQEHATLDEEDWEEPSVQVWEQRDGMRLAEELSSAPFNLENDNERLDSPFHPTPSGDSLYMQRWKAMINGSAAKLFLTMEDVEEFVQHIHELVMKPCEAACASAGAQYEYSAQLFGVPRNRMVLARTLHAPMLRLVMVMMGCKTRMLELANQPFILPDDESVPRTGLDDEEMLTVVGEKKLASSARERLLKIEDLIADIIRTAEKAFEVLKAHGEAATQFDTAWRARLSSQGVILNRAMLISTNQSTDVSTTILMHILHMASSQKLRKQDDMLMRRKQFRGVEIPVYEDDGLVEDWVRNQCSMDHNPLMWSTMRENRVSIDFLAKDVARENTQLFPKLQTPWSVYWFNGGAIDLCNFTVFFTNKKDKRVQRILRFRDYAIAAVKERLHAQFIVQLEAEHNFNTAAYMLKTTMNTSELEDLQLEYEELKADIAYTEEELRGIQRALAATEELFFAAAIQFFNDFSAACGEYGGYIRKKDDRRRMQNFGEKIVLAQAQEMRIATAQKAVDERTKEASELRDTRDTAEVLVRKCKEEAQRLTHMLFALENLVMDTAPDVCEQLIEAPFPYEDFARFLVPMLDTTTDMLHFNIDAFQCPEFITMLRFQEFTQATIDLLFFAIGRTTCPPKLRDNLHIIFYLYGASGAGKSVFMHVLEMMHVGRTAKLTSSVQEGFGLAEQMGSGDKQARVSIFPDLTNESAKKFALDSILRMAENAQMSFSQKGVKQELHISVMPHTFIASNLHPARIGSIWGNNSGALDRRFAGLKFRKPVRRQRQNLPNVIKSEELLCIAIRSAAVYRFMTSTNPNKGFWDAYATPTFKKERNQFKAMSDAVHAFLSDSIEKRFLKLQPDGYIALRDMQSMYAVWRRKQNARGRMVFEEESYSDAFTSLKLQVRHVAGEILASERGFLNEDCFAKGPIVVGIACASSEMM